MNNIQPSFLSSKEIELINATAEEVFNIGKDHQISSEKIEAFLARLSSINQPQSLLLEYVSHNFSDVWGWSGFKMLQEYIIEKNIDDSASSSAFLFYTNAVQIYLRDKTISHKARMKIAQDIERFAKTEYETLSQYPQFFLAQGDFFSNHPDKPQNENFYTQLALESFRQAKKRILLHPTNLNLLPQVKAEIARLEFEQKHWEACLAELEDLNIEELKDSGHEELADFLFGKGEACRKSLKN